MSVRIDFERYLVNIDVDSSTDEERRLRKRTKHIAFYIYEENMSKSASDETPDLSIEEETLDSYSLVFDKVKQNFSTSSEISFAKHVLSPIDQNQTIIKETAPKFNPLLLLFVQDDEILNSVKLTFFKRDQSYFY